MTKYRKKPVVIEATQWFKDGDHPHVLMCWFDDSGKVRWAPGDHQSVNIFGCVQKPAIATLEGWHAVTPGDFIITGVKGEHYPCKPDIFKMTYELASKEALAQPVQEPSYAGVRMWVGLTDEEIWSTVSRTGSANSDVNPYIVLIDARAIEAKLKEKNA